MTSLPLLDIPPLYTLFSSCLKGTPTNEECQQIIDIASKYMNKKYIFIDVCLGAPIKNKQTPYIFYLYYYGGENIKNVDNKIYDNIINLLKDYLV